MCQICEMLRRAGVELPAVPDPLTIALEAKLQSDTFTVRWIGGKLVDAPPERQHASMHYCTLLGQSYHFGEPLLFLSYDGGQTGAVVTQRVYAKLQGDQAALLGATGDIRHLGEKIAERRDLQLGDPYTGEVEVSRSMVMERRMSRELQRELQGIEGMLREILGGGGGGGI